MAADRFLDTDGLRHLWEKIKSFIHQNTHEYSVEELETPTAGYRNSYRLDKDGEAIEGSDIIDIPTEFTPIVSKEYTGTDFYAPSDTWDNSSRYFMSVRPDALKEYWYVKYRVRVWIPADTTEKRFTDSIIEYFGSGISMKGYRIWNTINTSYAAYYQVAYWLTNDGYNNQSLSNELGHIIGTSILYGSNYTTSSWYRHVKVDLLAYEGCEVNVFDNLLKWSEYKTSTGATNVATGIEHPDYGTTGPSTYNATSQGLQETGDATDITNVYLYYARFTAGTYGLMRYSLMMQDSQGKWQSFTTNSGNGATKTKNPSAFRLGSHIYQLVVSSTDYVANDIIGTGVVRAYGALIDFRYTLNITTTAGGANNLVPYKPLFIVGTIGNDGLFYLDDVWWTQDEPVTEDGKIYIKVSHAIYNDYTNDRCYRGDLLSDGYAYWYKDGLFQRYYGDFVTNAHLPEYTIEKLAQAETSYSASYVLKKDGTQVGATINIPKDMVVSNGEVKTVTTANVPYQGAAVGDKYIDLTIANTAQNHIYIPVKDLVDVYVAGNGIQISDNNYISVKINSNQSNGLGVGGDGVSLGVVTPSVNGVGGTNGAMLATDKEKLDGIEAGAEENVIETVKVSGTALQVTNKAVNIVTETAYDPTTNKIATMSDVESATPNIGHLKTDNTTAQTPSASEPFTGDINLHKIAKTGSYNDLNDKPTIPSSGDFVTSLGTSGNNVTWTKNGVTNNLTVPYATSAERLNITPLESGADMNDYTTEGIYGTSSTNICFSFVNAPSGRINGEMRLEVLRVINNSGVYIFQKYWGRNRTSWNLYMRTRYSGGWSDWVKNLDSGNGVPKVTSTDNAVVRFNGTGGDIQNSGVTINDSNQVTAAKFITSGGTSSKFVKGDGSLDSNTYSTRDAAVHGGDFITNASSSNTGTTKKDVYINNINDRLYSANKRFYVTHKVFNASTDSFVRELSTDIFKGDTEIHSNIIEASEYAVLYIGAEPEDTIGTDNKNLWTYGWEVVYLTFYINRYPDSITEAELYAKIEPRGWFNCTITKISNAVYKIQLPDKTYPAAIRIKWSGSSSRQVSLSDVKAFAGRSTLITESVVTKYPIKQDFWGNIEAPMFIKRDGTSSQFLKADGSVDNNTYATTAFVNTAISNKADKVVGATSGNFAGLDATGNLTDSGYSISDLENSINGQKVWFNCWTCEYGVHPYSLFSFAINPNKDGLCLTPFTTTGGTGNKRPVTTYWFPIGSNIYYHNSSEQAGQSGALKSGYTSFREVDVRYSAITGGNISLGSSINTSTYFYTTSVFLRVLISGEYWQPYHKSGSTTEILVSIDQLVAGNYYIYLGKLSAETTDGLHYILQLEDNNPLYYFDGNDLIMYTKRGNIPSGGTTRQFLAKRSNSDYDVEWIGPAAAFITAYDYQNHRVTISDGTHSQEYQLTPYYPIPDYYIGWEYGTKREFASMSGSHLANNATPYMKANNTSYQSECLDTIFYVMFKPSSAPTSGSLLSGDGVNSNKLLSQITAEEFLAGGNCPHNDVTIGETTYKVYALMNVYLADGDNTITVNFN